MAETAPRIGVTMRVAEATGYKETRDALASDWPVYLHATIPDATWLYLPNIGAAGAASYCEALGVTGLILSGGEDPGVHLHRDETERGLLDWAQTGTRPVLGVCRGMQLMAQRAGASLVPVSGHVATRHRIAGEITREVNSYHAIGLEACPNGYEVLARADDGSIEALGHQVLPWECWMWHPEREALADSSDVMRMRKVFGLT
ncbi:MAG: gamma-glutamyl-gamma-aminobutyrate hydrolase family protein [Pseudomonadota bacterium]